MSQTMYQVTAECVYATMDSPYGMTRQLLLKGAMIPGDAREIKHLVEQGLVAKVGGDDDTGINALGGVGVAESDQGAGGGSVVSATPPAPQPVEVVDPDAEAAKRRAEAAAKLPKDGSAPHANAGEPVWVEYAVAQGVDRGEAEKAGKDQLKALLVDKK